MILAAKKMTIKKILKCRMCEERAYFASLEDLHHSEWTEVAPLGLVDGEEKIVHQAYCPGHSIEPQYRANGRVVSIDGPSLGP